MKKIFVIIAALVQTFAVFAQERTEEEMLKIATNQLCPAGTRASARIDKIYSADMLGVYASSAGGMVVVSNRKEFSDVLGHTDNGKTITGASPEFIWWLKTINSSLRRKLERGESSCKVLPTRGTGKVLVTAEWGQGDPYNYSCPTISHEKVPTGCMATAMAQIMHYFKYPAKAIGSGYYTKGESERQYKANTTSTYDWSAMKNSYSGYNSLSRSEKEKVSKLLYECGVAAHMQYDSEGSGTYDYCGAQAMARNFQYDSLALRLYNRDFYTDKEWMEIVYNELENERPMVYSGADSVNGGHAFVMDGVDALGLVHLNWGWEGEDNGWFNIADLSPDPYNFSYGHSIICGLKAHSSIDNEDVYESQFVSYDPIYYDAIEKNQLGVSSKGIYTVSHLLFDGDFGLLLKNVSTGDNYFVNIVSTDGDPLDYGYGWGELNEDEDDFIYSQDTIDLADVPAGTYQITYASRAIEEGNTASPIRINEVGMQYTTLTKADDGTLTIGGTIGGDDVAAAISTVKTVATDNSQRIYDLNGRLLRSANTNIESLPNNHIYIIKQGGKARKIMK